MIKPLHDYILIEQEEAKTETASGFVVHHKEGEKTELGKVLEVSESVENIKKGDRVLFKSYSVDVVDVDGEKHTFIKFDDVIAVL